MKTFKETCLVICILLVGTITSANAGIMIDPVSATTDMGWYAAPDPLYSINNIRNQSGLSAGYTSGVTDFNTYIASNPTHTYDGGEWITDTPKTTGSIILDLGKVYSIDKLALWNEDYQGVAGFTVSVSTTGLAGSYTQVGTFAPVQTDVLVQYDAQVFALASTSLAQYVDITITDAFYRQYSEGFYNVGIGEIAFSAVPEPASLLLLGTGLLGLAGSRRKSKK